MSIITSFSFILLIIVHYVVSIDHIDVHLLFKSLNSGCDSIYNHFLQESSLFLLFVSRFYFIVWTTYWDGRWNVGVSELIKVTFTTLIGLFTSNSIYTFIVHWELPSNSFWYQKFIGFIFYRFIFIFCVYYDFKFFGFLPKYLISKLHFWRWIFRSSFQIGIFVFLY